MGSCHCKNSNEVSSIKVIHYKSESPNRHLTLAEQLNKLNDARANVEKKTEPAENIEIKLEQGSFMEVKKLIKIEGHFSDTKQTAFQDKLTTINVEEDQIAVLNKTKMWVCCKKGLKPNQPNQDDFVIVLDGDNFLVGVFDGHGIYGHFVSDFVHQELPKLLYGHPMWVDNPEKAMRDSFVKCHQNLIINSCNRESKYDCNMSGCTSTLVYKREKSLYIGHVGDSRAIIGRKTDLGFVPITLSLDHKPDLAEEQERIQTAGGEVRKLTGRNPTRVYFKGREYPGLSMTRAIGDLVSQSIGVVCNPETSEFSLGQNDEFLIVGSDGIWEFISNEEAVRLVSQNERNPKEAASKLAALAWSRWISNEGCFVDDITVIVTFFAD